jgi:hypothetical protein
LALVLTVVSLGGTLFMASSQSGMSVTTLLEKGFKDATGPSRLKGISDHSHIDLNALQTSGLALARERWSDATIISITAENVYPDGHADLTLGDGGTITMSIGSPDQAHSSDLPQGATGSNTSECLDVVVDTGTTFTNSRTFEHCWKVFQDGTLPKRPRCSVTQVWERAVEAGAPSKNAVASLTYTPWPNHSWYVQIGDFAKSIPDDCSKR